MRRNCNHCRWFVPSAGTLSRCSILCRRVYSSAGLSCRLFNAVGPEPRPEIRYRIATPIDAACAPDPVSDEAEWEAFSARVADYPLPWPKNPRMVANKTEWRIRQYRRAIDGLRAAGVRVEGV